jgi:hypothetical protein
MDIRTLKVSPQSITGAEKMPLVTDENGNLARLLRVNLSTFPDNSDREDALACGWLDISPYWNEPHDLVVNNDGVLEYQAK